MFITVFTSSRHLFVSSICPHPPPPNPISLREKWQMHKIFWPKWEWAIQRTRRRLGNNIKTDIKEARWNGVDWTYLSQDRVHCRAFVNKVMNYRFVYKAGNSVSSWATSSFSTRIVLYAAGTQNWCGSLRNLCSRVRPRWITTVSQCNSGHEVVNHNGSKSSVWQVLHHSMQTAST